MLVCVLNSSRLSIRSLLATKLSNLPMLYLLFYVAVTSRYQHLLVFFLESGLLFRLKQGTFSKMEEVKEFYNVSCDYNSFEIYIGDDR